MFKGLKSDDSFFCIYIKLLDLQTFVSHLFVSLPHNAFSFLLHAVRIYVCQCIIYKLIGVYFLIMIFGILMFLH